MSEANVQAAQSTPNAAEQPQGSTVLTASAAAPEAKPTQTEAAQAAAAPSAEAKPASEVKYELKLPDGSPLDPGIISDLTTFAKEKGIAPEIAQAILEKQHAATQGYAERINKEFEAQKKQWVAQVQGDKEIGGEAFKGNVEIAHRALKAFASDEFVSILESTGLGNHPELVRVFYRIGKQMADDKLVTGSAPGGGKKSPSELLYGKS